MKHVSYEVKDRIGLVVIDRQKALNALNSEVIADLEETIAMAEKDPELRVLVITGAGRSFVAGADIGEQQPLTIDGARKWGQRGSALMRRIEKLEIPTIAAVNGFALGGGCELALSCDIILASDQARFGQPEASLGITPGFSGTQRLPRRVGSGRAKELIFSGRMIRAEEALAIGLADHVYEKGILMEKAMEMARSFIRSAPVAVKYAKACIDRGMQVDIESGITLENELFAMCFATEDQKEGMAAFMEKRDACFRNA